jgi:hypothetical protein
VRPSKKRGGVETRKLLDFNVFLVYLNMLRHIVSILPLKEIGVPFLFFFFSNIFFNFDYYLIIKKNKAINKNIFSRKDRDMNIK